MGSQLFWFCLAIIATALVGGGLPLLWKRSDRALHLLLAVSTGIFLGAIFFHLLPELAEMGNDLAIWGSVLLALLAVYIVENVFFHAGAESPERGHAALGYATFFGLSFHSLAGGFALAASLGRPAMEVAVFTSIATHKMAAAFSLSSMFALGGFDKRRILALVGLFSLCTPAGALIGYLFLSQASLFVTAMATAVATGTFLYVALCDLLPEVFHHARDKPQKLALLAAGIILMIIVGGHS